jgi:putative PIN family toxin of toxin-antitoxin system
MKKTSRYVVDTNLLVSAVLLEESLPDIGIRYIDESGGTLVFSIETFEEFKSVLMRPKFDRYVSSEKRREVLTLFASSSDFVQPDVLFTHCRDAKDNKFLDVTVAAAVDCLISGDKDLLVMKEIEGIPILRMSSFLQA